MNGLLILLVSQCFMYIQGKPLEEDIERVFYMDFKPLSDQPKQDSEDCMFNLCNNTTGYNDHTLKSIVSKYTEYDTLFGNVLSKPVDIGNRNREVESNNMCSTKSVTMFPKRGLNIDGNWRNIVNVEGHYQMVNFEACDDGAQCYAKKEYLPIGIISSCETQYIEIRLVVLHENDTMGLERFKIPAGCSCMYAQLED